MVYEAEAHMCAQARTMRVASPPMYLRICNRAAVALKCVLQECGTGYEKMATTCGAKSTAPCYCYGVSTQVSTKMETRLVSTAAGSLAGTCVPSGGAGSQLYHE